MIPSIMKPLPPSLGTHDSIEQLCPQCGLCCDGTLFADVELRAADDARSLRRLGLELFKKGRTKLAFPQPCPGFDGRLCRLYEDRPQQCRRFECGLLKRVKSGEISARAALKKIGAAKNHAEKLRERLRLMGQRDEGVPLTHRYGDAMSQPVDLSVPGCAGQQSNLMRAMNALMQRLERDFLR